MPSAEDEYSSHHDPIIADDSPVDSPNTQSPHSTSFLLKNSQKSDTWKSLALGASPLRKFNTENNKPRIELDGTHEIDSEQIEQEQTVLQPNTSSSHTEDQSPLSAAVFKEIPATETRTQSDGSTPSTITSPAQGSSSSTAATTISSTTNSRISLLRPTSPLVTPHQTSYASREIARPQSEILDIIREQKEGKVRKISLLSHLKHSFGLRTPESPKKTSILTLQDMKTATEAGLLNEGQSDPLRRPLPPLSTTSIIHFDNENQLRTKIITWNMDGHMPVDEDVDDLRRFLEPEVHHIYAIGTQNCERSAFASFFVQQKIEWEQMLCELLGPCYVALASSTLLSTHLIVFVRKDLLPWISNLFTSQVATGFLNEVGNRGATSVSFNLGATSFIFINAHFPGGQNSTEQRNRAYEKIIDLIAYKGKTKDGNIFREINRIFFFGDLNYRVNGNRGIVDSVLTKGTMHIMLQNDQLTLMRAEGRAFNVFVENDIEFKPTFKFAPERNVYDDGEKQSIPSWADRVLWVPNNDNIQQLSYEACFQIRCSSHRPVGARFLSTVDVRLYKPLSESTRSQPLLATSHACSVQ